MTEWPLQLRRCFVLMCATAVLSGCATWRASPDVLHEPIPPRQPLQIWSQGRALTVHGVVVQGDSVRAVPRWQPPNCDSCAVYYARADIDSVRVRAPAPVRTTLLITVLASLAAFAITMALSGPWMS